MGAPMMAVALGLCRLGPAADGRGCSQRTALCRIPVEVSSGAVKTALKIWEQAAVLSTLDYPDLAGEMLHGANVFAIIGRLDREQRMAVAGAISTDRV